MAESEEPGSPTSLSPTGERRRGRGGRKGRPAFGLLVGMAIVFRIGRSLADDVARAQFGWGGVAAVAVLGIALVVGWRMWHRRRSRAAGGEFTAEAVIAQIEASELGPPAFPEDGTLLGASVLVINQHAKILEVHTDYDIFGSAGQQLGTVRQIGQSRTKAVARILTVFDQFFTHHFDVLDAHGQPVIRLTRPRKVFLTKLHVFDGHDWYLGTIRQRNVFWKIRFEIVDLHGQVVGQLRAENLRAWDFQVLDRTGRLVAEVVKSWEGWGRTAFTRADHYVVKVHEPLVEPMRRLTMAAAIAADVALKQDARGLG
jgi:uncharacterized protein YxjI